MEKYTILIVDDDKSLGESLSDFFEDNDYMVFYAEDGISALELYRKHSPDVILADIEMPGKNGLQIMAEIREVNLHVPILIMTGHWMEESDSLKSYETGANLYIRKPFSPKELLAYMNSLMKTIYGDKKKYMIGKSVFNLSLRILTVNQVDYTLRGREFDVLLLLYKHSNQLISTKDILLQIWKSESQSNLQMLKNIITQFRKKFEEDNLVNIESVYGKGYILKIKF